MVIKRVHCISKARRCLYVLMVLGNVKTRYLPAFQSISNEVNGCKHVGGGGELKETLKN